MFLINQGTNALTWGAQVTEGGKGPSDNLGRLTLVVGAGQQGRHCPFPPGGSMLVALGMTPFPRSKTSIGAEVAGTHAQPCLET